MNEDMEKLDSDELLMLTSSQSGVLPAQRVIGLRLAVETAQGSTKLLNLVVPVELGEALARSLDRSLERLRSLQ